MMAADNPWGAERIRGELLKLGIKVSKRTIQKYMRRVRKPRAPSRQRWSTFFDNHIGDIWVCDFLQLYDVTFRPIFAFFIVLRALELERTSFSIVTGSGEAKQEKLWNEYVERYHYLGYGVPLGPHIKYFVQVRQEPIACVAFAGAAWRVEARDRSTAGDAPR